MNYMGFQTTALLDIFQSFENYNYFVVRPYWFYMYAVKKV